MNFMAKVHKVLSESYLVDRVNVEVKSNQFKDF